MKNIELFDKVSLRFNGRILFIKDVIGSQEICCWTFYGHGQKLQEVCCTSIVYGTDKKHTKVRNAVTFYHILISLWGPSEWVESESELVIYICGQRSLWKSVTSNVKFQSAHSVVARLKMKVIVGLNPAQTKVALTIMS